MKYYRLWLFWEDYGKGLLALALMGLVMAALTWGAPPSLSEFDTPPGLR